MNNEIILSHCGKLGDFLYCLPIGEWIHRTTVRKIHWVLPRCFGPFNYIENLLLAQPMTARVSLVDHKVRDYNCGGQPYRFNVKDFGIEGEYYNLGFRHYPTSYCSKFYAEEYGFDYVRDYRINLGEPLPKTLEVLRSTEGPMAKFAPHAKPLPTNMDLLALARRMQAAKEANTWFCGLAILCCMSGIPVIVHRVPGHASIPLYYEGDCRHVTFVEHEAVA
jgi:hypothetical protein